MDRLTALLQQFQPRALQVLQRALVHAEPHRCTATPDSLVYHLAAGSAQLGIGATEVPLATGDLLWLPGGREHRLQATDAQGCRLVEIRLDLGAERLNPLFDSLPSQVHLPAADDESAELAPMAELIGREAAAHRCGHGLVLNRLAEVLLVQMLRFLMSRQALERGILAGLGEPRLAAAITAIHEQPDAAWTVHSLARRAGMSRTAFSTRFRERVGQAPAEYLTLYRMRLARQWLTQGGRSIAEIGERLGYQSETAFRRAFRKVTGQTPGRLRRAAAA